MFKEEKTILFPWVRRKPKKTLGIFKQSWKIRVLKERKENLPDMNKWETINNLMKKFTINQATLLTGGKSLNHVS